MKKYTSQDEIDQITAAIYNDDNDTLYTLLPDYVEEDINEQVWNEESFIRINNSHFYLRKDGRLFNGNTGKPSKPVFTEDSLVTNLSINNKPYCKKFKDIFEENGLEYDHEEMIANYMQKGWKIYIAGYYKKKYPHLDY